MSLIQASKREKILKGVAINLTDVASLIDNLPNFRPLFIPGKNIWKRYFQSPVDKAAHVVGTQLQLNNQGALIHYEAARDFLTKWLGVGRKTEGSDAIDRWLQDGRFLPDSVLDKIKDKLNEDTLTNHALYNQPVCRLVRSDQLRYDPDYQAIYQLTPAQSRLIGSEPKDSVSQSLLDQVDRNRRVYWGISATFQSLVAMFDSELGGRWNNGDASGAGQVSKERETKEFIRV